MLSPFTRISPCLLILTCTLGKGPASGVGAAFNHSVVADDWGGLGGAIALEDLDSKHLPLAAQIPVKGSRRRTR